MTGAMSTPRALTCWVGRARRASFGFTGPEGRMVFATVTTTTYTGDEPPENATIVAEEMERWLRDLEGFQGFVLLANEERAVGVAFWASREVAEHYASVRSQFRERALSVAGVRIEEVVDYDVAFARFAPGFGAAAM